jgi:pimeloyl-ACP methyl ester carboxylesterase
MTRHGGDGVRHERVQADGVELHVACAGAGPPVILLHGFPENWTSWRWQIEPLVTAGFSVIAADLRGYGGSDRPRGLAAYHLRHLVEDVACLVRWSGEPRAHIMGHDWGGIVAWTFAGVHPELTDKLIILNAPHLDIFLRHVRRPPQMLRSWYVLLFRVPALPEWLLSRNDFSAVRHMFRALPARKEAFSESTIAGYVGALAAPGALTAALNYYRALLAGDALAFGRRARVAAETLVIWGERDPALGLELLQGVTDVAPRACIHRIPDAGHWVQNEAPDEVNRATIEFLSRERV